MIVRWVNNKIIIHQQSIIQHAFAINVSAFTGLRATAFTFWFAINSSDATTSYERFGYLFERRQ